MVDYRTVEIGGVWADGANDPPAIPISEITYKDSGITEGEINAGQPYNVRADSSKWNEMLYRITTLLGLSEIWGILPWSALTTYSIGSQVLGSNGTVYSSLQNTNINHDPVSSPTYWRDNYGTLTTYITNLSNSLSAHVNNTSNPHSVTKTQVGLGNVPNINLLALSTMTIFHQTAAPLNWTKITDSTYNERAIRIITGGVGLYGSVNFSSIFTSATPIIVDGTSLNTYTMAYHAHSLSLSAGTTVVQPDATTPVPIAGGGLNTGYWGGGGPHLHTGAVNLAVKYLDVILAYRST